MIMEYCPIARAKSQDLISVKWPVLFISICTRPDLQFWYPTNTERKTQWLAGNNLLQIFKGWFLLLSSSKQIKYSFRIMNEEIALSLTFCTRARVNSDWNKVRKLTIGLMRKHSHSLQQCFLMPFTGNG